MNPSYNPTKDKKVTPSYRTPTPKAISKFGFNSATFNRPYGIEPLYASTNENG
jgi:hypothetical protein